MSNDELKVVLLTALKTLLSSTSFPVPTPLTSLDLLTRVMSVPIPQGLLPQSPPPKFKLTDLGKFERMLEELSESWEQGWVVLCRPGITNSAVPGKGKMMIYEIGLWEQDAGKYGVNKTRVGSSGSGTISSENAGGSQTKKRKRVVDEDADSAAGDAEEEEEAPLSGQTNEVGVMGVGATASGAGSTFANLSPEMREVYAFIQKGTAKGRLLAERVRFHLLKV